MGYQLQFNLTDTTTLTIEAANAAGLVTQFENLGGDGKALRDSVKLAAKASLYIASTSTPPSLPAPADDPWADEAQQHEPSEDDPWGADEPVDDNQSFSEPASSSNNSSAGSNGSAPYVTRDKFQREFTHNAPGAPSCQHGDPAVKMKAKKKDNSGTYSKWVCERSCDDRWKTKCDFSEYV